MKSISRSNKIASPYNIVVVAYCLSFLMASLSTRAQSTLTAVPDSAVLDTLLASPYRLISRDSNQKVWSRITWETNTDSGKVIAKTNSYVELATGSAHLVNGAWVDSNDQIQIGESGAEAANCQHRVAFLGNINTSQAIDITLPQNGGHLAGSVVGLAYEDTADGKSVLIAELKDSQGQLLPSGNQVLYPDAFIDIEANAVHADLLYRNSISEFEQLVVIRQQLPSPAEWGLTPETTVLQVITEFINPPKPRITQSQAEGDTDQQLDFGAMQMVRGNAFVLGTEPGSIPVSKQWLVLGGRQCLIEQTPYKSLEPMLKRLPGKVGHARLHLSPDPTVQGLARMGLPKRSPQKQSTPLILAQSEPPAHGVAIDFTLLTSQTNFTFQADRTYYVSASVNLSSTTTWEGGSVTKIAPTNNVAINVNGPVTWAGSMYRPIIITGRDDNTVGDVINGSTGNPLTNFYGNTTGTIKLNYQPTTAKFLRISYAKVALSAWLLSSNWGVSHSQFINCQKAIYSGGDDNSLFTLRNVLFYNINQLGGGDVGFLNGEHLTLNQVTNEGTFAVSLTNCLVVASSGFSGGVSNAYSSSASGVLQTIGAAAHYLADGSIYRNAGTTNINTNLLAELRQRTTYPPLVLSNTISSDTTLSPQAQRDTDVPDIGYHYDPVDYAANGITLTNTLLLTNGVVLGTYGSGVSYGISIGVRGNFISTGSPTALNWIVRYNTVQEQSITNWSSSSSAPSISVSTSSTPLPQGQFRFTAWSGLGINGDHFKGTKIIDTPFVFRDCQFAGGGFSPGGSGDVSVAITNCLFERVKITLSEDKGDPEDVLFNCLLRGGSIELFNDGSKAWSIKDTLFDQTSISGQSGNISHDHNGYVSGANRLTPTNVNDVVLTNAPTYQTSYLGNYYYPTNDGMLGKLIDAGSRYATNATLYHYCTTTNQVKEGSSKVDIGFHYVAVDAATGLPFDTDGDGIPDYLEDLNGNGVVDSGESDWNAYNSPNGLSAGSGLQVFTPLKP